MNRQRIFHVTTTVNRGGAENHVYDLVQHQCAAGFDVQVAYLRGDHRDLGVPVYPLGLRYYGQLAPLRKLRRLIRAFRPDLVHAHMPPAELYTRLALLGTGPARLPMLITKHNEEPFYRGPGQKLLGRWVARRAAAIIAISRAVQRYMAGDGLGVPRSKLHTIYYGIDPWPFLTCSPGTGAALRRDWGVPADAFLVGFVGRFAPQKSIDTLLRAFARLRERQGPDAWLALVGTGHEEPALRALTEDLGVAHRVVWGGFREDMPAVMRAFDVFALTSLYEGFGLVLVEAMATRLPVVATGTSAMAEVVVDGETGLLVPARAVDDVAEALEKLQDPTLRARLGAAGCRRVCDEFTLDKMFQATDELYAVLTPENRRGPRPVTPSATRVATAAGVASASTHPS
jgi:glycosyltransferase involved in cell wall biosynthesis